MIVEITKKTQKLKGKDKDFVYDIKFIKDGKTLGSGSGSGEADIDTLFEKYKEYLLQEQENQAKVVNNL